MKTKIRRKPRLEGLLKRLKAAVGKRRGATEAAIRAAEKKVGCTIPPAWQRVMRTVDGGTIATRTKECEEFDMSKAKDFGVNNRFARRFIMDGWPELPEAYVAVACNEYHDFFFLDTSKIGRGGECPVMFIDHEECRVQRKWPSIAALLDHILRGVPRRGDRGGV